MRLCRRCYIRRPFQPPAALALSAIQRLPDPPRPDARNPRLSWRGLHGSARALAIAQAAAADERLLLVVAADARALDDLARELRFFAPPDLPLLQLPDWEVLPYDLFSPHPDIISERLSTLSQLPQARRGILRSPRVCCWRYGFTRPAMGWGARGRWHGCARATMPTVG